MLQATLQLFCSRLYSGVSKSPSAPDIRYTLLTGTAPHWAIADDIQSQDPQVYFELTVIFADPVVDLKADNLAIEIGDLVKAVQTA